MKRITGITYNYNAGKFDSYKLGENDVERIIEHPPGEGWDRGYFDVKFVGGKFKRIYNPNTVDYDIPLDFKSILPRSYDGDSMS